MLQTLLQEIQCPYCGENIQLLVDNSIEKQNYIEDCSVCCQPIELEVIVESNEAIEIKPVRQDDS